MPASWEREIEGRYLKRGLRLNHLRLLQVLRQSGSLSRAADILATSQPAASRLLSEAEQITGVKLAERSGRGMMLTLFGESLADRAQMVLRELDEAAREIENLKTGLTGSVAVGAVTGAALEYVLPAIRQTRVTHPGVQVHVEVNTSDQLTQALDAGRIDFFIGRVPDTVNPRAYDAEYLDEEPIALVARAEHPLTRRDSVTLEDCTAFDWVMQPEGSMLRVAVEGYMRRRGIAYPAKVLSTSSVLLMLVAVSQSNAVTAVARPVAEFLVANPALAGAARSGPGGALVPLKVEHEIALAPYSVVKLADRRLTPVSQNFLDLLQSLSRRGRMGGLE
ncbi:LysR family transcriptional regulator [Roseibium aestuarii]|uniref:LysR family transcriptional regulator n=1 Tax=Roseibium aestuarii TaxID=2600299 RepID=A0ABW4JVA9_9HYPH|nr:LysR family transcriptional regulator [Roseibium aestuarii]